MSDINDPAMRQISNEAAAIQPVEHWLSAADFDFRVRVYPAVNPSGPVLVWMHGGAFVFGSLEMPEADWVARELAARGVVVVSVDYTLAPMEVLAKLPKAEAAGTLPDEAAIAAELAAAGPRAPYPVASMQVAAAYDWAVAHAAELGGDQDRVAIGGASAGGNLAAGAVLRLRDRGSVPAAAALIYPVLHNPLPPADADLERALEGLPAALTFPPEFTEPINANYLAGAPSEAYAFPGGTDLGSFAPTLIVAAERDRLRASAEAFVDELREAGVAVEYESKSAALHGFLNEVGDAGAIAVIHRIAAFLEDARRG